jgi:hypothetical protein
MNKDSLAKGLVFTLAGHVVWIFAVLLVKFGFSTFGYINSISGIAFFLIVLLGLSQWFYLVPLILWFKMKNLLKTTLGLFVGGCITFVLNLAIILWLYFMVPDLGLL